MGGGSPDLIFDINPEHIDPNMHTSIIKTTSIDIFRISNWNRLFRAQSYVLRLTFNVAAKLRQTNRKHGPLTSDEILQAENELFKKARHEDFPEERKKCDNYPIISKLINPAIYRWRTQSQR